MSNTLNFLAPQTESGRLPFTLQPDVPDEYYSAVQTWVMAFLTDRGSRPLIPEYGTKFVKTLGAGRLYTEADVRLTFGEASASALSFCENDDTVYVTAASLTDVRVDSSSESKFIVLYVAFVFSDGKQTRTFIEV